MGATLAPLMLDLLLLLMVFFWASNYSLVKVALREFPALSFNALRLVLASGLFLLTLAVLRARARRGQATADPPFTRQEWMAIAALGLVGTVCYQLFFLEGVARTSVANAALIFGCTPIVVALLSSAVGHDRLTPLRWAGAGLSFVGIYVLVGLEAELSRATLVGDALSLAAVLCWAVYSVGAQPILRRHSPIVVTGSVMIAGTLLYLPVAARSLVDTRWSTISGLNWALLAGSSLLSLWFAYIVWYTAVQKIGSARTAVYSNLTPMVAMLVAWVWLGEQISATQVAGAALILGGLAVTRLGQ